MRTRRLTFLACVALLAFAVPAAALSIRITDPNLEGLVGHGESNGRSFVLYVDAAASGPVVIFVMDAGKQTRLTGWIREGRIIIDDYRSVALNDYLKAKGFSVTVQTERVNAPRTTTPSGQADAPKGHGNGDEKDNPGKGKVNPEKGKGQSR